MKTGIWNNTFDESHCKFFMFKPKQLLFLGLISLFFSCKNGHTYTFAIKDFRKQLQPYLTRIVTEGIVISYDTALRKMATDNELKQLGQSEHPVLRAVAFNEMLERKSFNRSQILTNHLDDTATVLVDEGEFGIARRTVSDYILLESRWYPKDDKSNMVEEILTRHNYLRSAYIILDKIEPQQKYYRLIKDMATRPRHPDSDGYELAFGEVEYALYGLAGFKKDEDINIIKQRLMRNVWQLSYISFRLMKEYPDTAYLDIFEAYHHRQFYNFSGNRRDGFSGFVPDKAEPEDFIQAVVVQENERSAKLLDTILDRLDIMPCMPDKQTIEEELVKAILEHPVAAYSGLQQKIKLKSKK
jgi:hypothetical protein